MLVSIDGVTRVYMKPVQELCFPEDGMPISGATISLRPIIDTFPGVRFNSKGTRAERREMRHQQHSEISRNCAWLVCAGITHEGST